MSSFLYFSQQSSAYLRKGQRKTPSNTKSEKESLKWGGTGFSSELCVALYKRLNDMWAWVPLAHPCQFVPTYLPASRKGTPETCDLDFGIHFQERPYLLEQKLPRQFLLTILLKRSVRFSADKLIPTGFNSLLRSTLPRYYCLHQTSRPCQAPNHKLRTE
mgnify:CR=1 FL=1